MWKITHEIGPERPTSAIQRGIYVGSSPRLQGQTAYISRCYGGWNVQVDDVVSEFAYGWWKFPLKDWQVT